MAATKKTTAKKPQQETTTKQVASPDTKAKAKARSAAAKKAAATRKANKAKAALEHRDESGKFLPGYTPPTTFADRPEDRHSGRWKKENSISYQYNRFMAMSAIDFKKWRDTNPAELRSMAEDIAYTRVWDARNASGRIALDNTREITDRTEGKPAIIAHIDHSDADSLPTPEKAELKTARLIERRKQLNALRRLQD